MGAKATMDNVHLGEYDVHESVGTIVPVHFGKPDIVCHNRQIVIETTRLRDCMQKIGNRVASRKEKQTTSAFLIHWLPRLIDKCKTRQFAKGVLRVGNKCWNSSL